MIETSLFDLGEFVADTLAPFRARAEKKGRKFSK